MDLKTNICDAVKECEIKLGYRKEAINLYYPESALLELLETDQDTLPEKIADFCHSVEKEMGNVTIAETQETGRYCVSVSAEGVEYVHRNVIASPFMIAFVQEIHKPGMKKEDIVDLFYEFSRDVVVERVEEKEWAVYFRDVNVDAYVYYMEEDDFGMQYHRFTRKTFDVLRKELNGR